jgi:hypothetical protein
MSERWSEIAQHPEGFVLSTHVEMKPPWVALRLAHPQWVDHRKQHRFVWLNWSHSAQCIRTASKSPVTMEFEAERPDVWAWVADMMKTRG